VGAAPRDEFELFFETAEPRLRRAFAAGLGADRGREALAEAMAWAWEHRERLATMDNPIGYLYRVGRSRTRNPRRRVLFPGGAEQPFLLVEPALVRALVSLSEQQRVVVVLVHGYGWTQREAAELLEIAPSTVQKHLERALARLRAALEVTHA
jgi:DNA-directed RNA polymerase specialized sigma24 family protein